MRGIGFFRFKTHIFLGLNIVNVSYPYPIKTANNYCAGKMSQFKVVMRKKIVLFVKYLTQKRCILISKIELLFSGIGIKYLTK